MNLWYPSACLGCLPNLVFNAIYTIYLFVWHIYLSIYLSPYLGHQRTPLCRWMPAAAGEVQAEAGDQGRPGHDHPHHHALPTQRGRDLSIYLSIYISNLLAIYLSYQFSCCESGTRTATLIYFVPIYFCGC